MSKIVDKFISDYNSETDIKKRFRSLIEFVNVYYDSDFLKVNALLEKELELCLRENLVNGEAMIRFMLGYSAFEQGNLQKGNEEVDKVMAIFDRVTSHEVRAQVLNFLAYMNSHQGNFEKAFQHIYECIREAELAEDKKNQFWGVYTLGVFHFDLKDYANSQKCFSEAIAGFTKNDNPYGIARSETGLSSVYIQLEKFKEAEKLLQRSLAYYKEIEALSGQSRSLNDLAVIFSKTNQLEKALDCFKQALKIRKETNHAQGIATSLNEIAEVLLTLKKFDETEKYLLEAKLACERVNNRSKLYRTHFLFSQLYRNINQPWKALEHYEKYDELKTEVQGQTANNKIKELQTKMATEKADKEKEIERLKNVELKSAYDIIADKNKEILDSIHYAKRIQQSLLPTEIYIERNLKRLLKKQSTS